jgi:hypothetical protein
LPIFVGRGTPLQNTPSTPITADFPAASGQTDSVDRASHIANGTNRPRRPRSRTSGYGGEAASSSAIERSTTSQAFAVLKIEARNGRSHHSATAKQYHRPWHTTVRQSTMHRRRVLVSALSFTFPRPRTFRRYQVAASLLANAKVAADLPGVNRPRLVSESGAARDHEAARNPRKDRSSDCR